MKHLACSDVRKATCNIPDRIHADCHVPESVSQAYQRWSPYESLASDDGQKPKLSDTCCTVRDSTVCLNDGDGIVLNVDWELQEPLQNAVYTRLNGINAPELSAVYFVKTDNLTNVFCKRSGHLSLCAVHFFLKLFVLCGSAELHEEIPKVDIRSPIDFYGRPLKEFWFKFSSAPTEQVELSLLSSLESFFPAELNACKRRMSPYPASQATTDKPFLMSLNALLVVTGFFHVFTKYC